MAVPEAAPETVLPLVAEGMGYSVRGATLLDDVSFRLEAGGCSVFLGPNGAGKSLTLRLCHGLLAPTRGRLRWLGPAGGGAAQRVAMVRQRPVLLRRSAAANVDYALCLRRLPRAERRARTAAALEATGLARLARRPARRLSGGEQQRLALARAWATRPQVLLLDEPAASLDPEAQRALEAAVRRVRAAGTKIAMSTHDLGQARRLADEVLFLHGGRLLEQTPAEEFFEKPRSREARAFLGGEIP